MKTKQTLAALTLGLAAAMGTGLVALPAQADDERAFEVVEGQVIKIDVENTVVTLRSSDGSLHEFKASSETLKTLKLGDRIEAKRRPPATSTSD